MNVYNDMFCYDLIIATKWNLSFLLIHSYNIFLAHIILIYVLFHTL